MACKRVIKRNVNIQPTVTGQAASAPAQNGTPVGMVFFGVNSTARADTVLQHNITLFEWVLRNQSHPYFWGRTISGENALTADEMNFIQTNGCKIIPIYSETDASNMTTHQQGATDANKVIVSASGLSINPGTTLYMQIDPLSNVSSDYMLGYAKAIISSGYIPGFYANTDALYDFDHQFSRGYQANPDTFKQCQIWAMSPDKPELYQTTDAHTTLPDCWGPFCPSCLTKDQISIWQFGNKCHPIQDYSGNNISINISIAKNPENYFEVTELNLGSLNITKSDNGLDVSLTATSTYSSYTVQFNCDLLKFDADSLITNNKAIAKINSSNFTVLNFSICSNNDILNPQFAVDDGFALVKCAFISNNSGEVFCVKKVINLSDYEQLSQYLANSNDNFTTSNDEKSEIAATEFWEIKFHEENTNQKI